MVLSNAATYLLFICISGCGLPALMKIFGFCSSAS